MMGSMIITGGVTAYSESATKAPGHEKPPKGGSFIFGLQKHAAELLSKSHQRSGTNDDGSTASPNTTHGSGWIVQVLPTSERRLDPFFESHPREWVDRSSPAYEESPADAFL